MTSSFRNALAKAVSYKPDGEENEPPHDQIIYRIFEKNHFFEMFEERKNTLVLPCMWDDPHENLLRKVRLKNPKDNRIKNGIYGDSFIYGTYAQCWGAHEVPNIMWCIYPNKTEALQVETTVGKLINGMRDGHERKEDHFCIIDEIDYLNKEEIKSRIRELAYTERYNVKELIRYSLLVKCKIFDYEREIRIIYIGSNNTNPSNRTYGYNIDPHELIDRVIINPRTCPREYVRLKKEIKERTNLDCERIKHYPLSETKKADN